MEVQSNGGSSSEMSATRSVHQARRARQLAAKAASAGKLTQAFAVVGRLEEELRQCQGALRQLQQQPDGMTKIVVDSRIAGRLKALTPCLLAQHLAAEKREVARSSRGLVDCSTHILGNAARHHFAPGLRFDDVDATAARRSQHASRRHLEAQGRGGCLDHEVEANEGNGDAARGVACSDSSSGPCLNHDSEATQHDEDGFGRHFNIFEASCMRIVELEIRLAAALGNRGLPYRMQSVVLGSCFVGTEAATLQAQLEFI